MVTFTVSDFNHTQLINAGRTVQKAWIFANKNGISVHPMLSPAFFFNRLIHGGAEEISQNVADKLTQLRTEFIKVFPVDAAEVSQKEVFIMKLSIADQIGLPSLRKDKNELFYKF